MLLFFFQAEDGIRDLTVTGVQTCALPICVKSIEAFIADSPACSSDLTRVGGDRKSMAMSPPRLNVGSNSFRTRKTSRSYLPGSCLGSMYTGPTCPLYCPAARFAPARL